MAEPRRGQRAAGAAGGSGRRGRLSRSAEFDRVYRHGRANGNRWLVLYSFPRDRGDDPRLGLSVSRRVGGAVERNRVKRLLREAFWAQRERIPAAHDFVIVARPDVRGLAEQDGLDGVGRALGELLAQAAEGSR